MTVLTSCTPQVALVTGAAQGLGLAIARRLASDGYAVALADLPSSKATLHGAVSSLSKGDKGGSTRHMVVTADVSDEAQVREMIEQVVKELGSLDVMVSNAGICLMKPMLDTSPSDLNRILSVNVQGTFNCYTYAARQMIAQGSGGRIIGACSGTGKKGEALFSAYSASKAAIRALTQCAALEFGAHGITVNAYAPGPVKTPMYEGFETVLGTPDGALEEQVAKQTALGKIATTEDVAGVVSFLASENAKAITGQCLNVDGGRHFD
ncbi:NAD(P)-binding protein [Peniophora sp. CONT]|nr:NAD(P)-binding protein [Peniophora sp. CONT]